ncbi:MAG TPA: DNA polymerase III subunit delta [Negativicutes bacterium]|nr:DNA polymerase III subunit delta [Negativicutes bacterium]
MDYQAAVAELKRGKLYPVYLIWGEERLQLEDLVAEIRKGVLGAETGEYGLTVLNGKDLTAERIIEAADTAPFFSEKQIILVENWPPWCATGKIPGGDQKLGEYLSSKIPSYTCLVFTSQGKADRRKKLYQTIEKAGAVIELAPLKGPALERWLTQFLHDWGKKPAPGVMNFIIGEAGTSETLDLALLQQEMTKIALYTGERPEITKADARAVLTRTPESSVFALVNAVSLRQRDKAQRLWADLKVGGEEPLKLLSLLARQIRLLWQTKQLLQEGCTGEQIAGKIGVPPYVARKIASQVDNFTGRQLRYLLECIQEADWSVKCGRRDQETMMQLLIIKMCQKEKNRG